MGLIREAIKALETQSLEAVSMRHLAGAIGVSHNAPYMHFPDKEALWLAVSDAGFEILIQEIEKEIGAHSEWRDRVEAGCSAYVKFAQANREYLLVMFRPATPGKDRALSPKGAEALDLLARELGNGVSKGQLKEAEPRKLAVLIWIFLHGITMAQLQIGGQRGPLLELADEDQIGWMLDQILATRS